MRFLYPIGAVLFLISLGLLEAAAGRSRPIIEPPWRSEALD
jgi:hypothetical protein